MVHPALQSLQFPLLTTFLITAAENKVLAPPALHHHHHHPSRLISLDACQQQRSLSLFLSTLLTLLHFFLTPHLSSLNPLFSFVQAQQLHTTRPPKTLPPFHIGFHSSSPTTKGGVPEHSSPAVILMIISSKHGEQLALLCPGNALCCVSTGPTCANRHSPPTRSIFAWTQSWIKSKPPAAS